MELIFETDTNGEELDKDALADLICDILLAVSPQISGGGVQWCDLSGTGRLDRIEVA